MMNNVCFCSPFRSHLLATELYKQDIGNPAVAVHHAANDSEYHHYRHVLSRLLAQHFGALLQARHGSCPADELGKVVTQPAYTSQV